MKEFLISPIYASMRYNDSLEDYDENEYWRDDISSATAADYVDEVTSAIEKDRQYFNNPAGLMEFYHDEDLARQEMMKDKIISAQPYVEIIDGNLYGVMALELKEPLSPKELADLKDYVTGQYSDGFGESFEQREIKTNEGDLYVSFWSADKNYALDTLSEFEDRTGQLVDETMFQNQNSDPDQGMMQQL